MRILISLAAGGVGAALLYMIFRIGIYIAGGVLGLILASLINSLLGLSYTGGDSLILVISQS